MDPKNILDDFEVIQQRAQNGGFTLSSEYRMIKTMQSLIQKSLLAIRDEDAVKFIPLYTAVEHIRIKISQEYEKRKIINNRLNQLQKLENSNNSPK